MSNKEIADPEILTLIGMSLMCVQQAEKILTSAVCRVLNRSDLQLADQPESKRKKTLGDFILKLKSTTKLEYGLKERLFTFLDMRNTFVHDVSKVQGWDLKTEEGGEAAKAFLCELCFTSLAISSLFTTLFLVSAKDEFGEDLVADENKRTREIAEALESHFGAKARKILSGRQPNLAIVRPK